MKLCSHEYLKDQFEVEQKKLEGIRKQFPWGNQQAYLSWLTNTYEYAVKSTRILALTGGKFPTDKTVYSNRFIAHAAEEKGHEKLLENDVKNFGLNIKNLAPSNLAKAFHQSLYYWIYEANPIGIFGWVLALEGFAVRNVPAMYEVCKSVYGPQYVSFLKVHAEEDEDHLNKAFQSLKGFTEEENGIVVESMLFYTNLYGDMLLNTQEATLASLIVDKYDLAGRPEQVA
ncbi:MAG: iron-containing redox enzyme family protein [Pseudobdellovibrionaceae bacterium]